MSTNILFEKSSIPLGPLAIARHWDRPVLVMDDPGGVPLDELLLVARNASTLAHAGGQPLEPFQALASSGDKAFSMRLAISLSTAIGRLHQRGLIHKDIKPGNVLVNPATVSTLDVPSGKCHYAAPSDPN